MRGLYEEVRMGGLYEEVGMRENRDGLIGHGVWM